MKTKSMMGMASAFGVALSSVHAATVLIDPNTRNGSFELLNGAQATAKATDWDNDPDGDVDNWTQWAGASGDSGAENNAGNASDGSRIAFMQAMNQVYNLTGHTIAVGDVISYSWDHVARADRVHKGGLVFDDGGTVEFFSFTGATITTDGLTLGEQSGSYTVQASDTAIIGKELGFGLQAISAYPELDNVVLSVQPVPEPSSFALLGLSALAWMIRRRR